MDTAPHINVDDPLPTPTGSDRRTAGRFICSHKLAVRIIARPSFQSYAAILHDFAMRGVGLLTGRAFEPGTVLAIQLRSARTGLSCILSATVKHTRELPDGQWLLGCSLSRRLTDDEVMALL